MYHPILHGDHKKGNKSQAERLCQCFLKICQSMWEWQQPPALWSNCGSGRWSLYVLIYMKQRGARVRHKRRGAGQKNNKTNLREMRQRGRISVCLKNQISFTRRGENMEQPSLLLQLSSSLHQLNMDYTGGGEEERGKGGFRRQKRWWRGWRRRKDEEEEGEKQKESREAFSSRL